MPTVKGLDPIDAYVGDRSGCPAPWRRRFKSCPASVLEHLAAVEIETFAELNSGLYDQLLENRLALQERQFPDVLAIEIQEVKRHHHDLVGRAFQLVLQDGEIGSAIRRGDDNLAVDYRGLGIDQIRVSRDLAEAPCPVIAASREYSSEALL